MLVQSYPYRGDIDTQKMRALLVAMRSTFGHGCWHVGDLTWRLFLHSRKYDLGQTVRLWQAPNDELLGFMIFSPPAAQIGFELQVCAEAKNQGIEDQMLDWLLAQWHDAMKTMPDPSGGTLHTDVGVYEDDGNYIAALERRGFTRSNTTGALLLYPLDEPLPQVTLPQGFTIRPVAGKHEAAARAATHRAAFDSTRMTEKAYLRLMQTPGYDPELDLVAVAPGGLLAAFGVVWIDSINKVGEFEPLGTHPDFRQKGLARAVLAEGLRRMKAQGAENAIVGPVDDAIALLLYQSIGFRAIKRTCSYIKELGCSASDTKTPNAAAKNAPA